MTEKLCIFCKHATIEDSRDYSESMGSCGAIGLACRKGQFSEFDSEGVGLIEEYRALIQRAVICKDYEALK